MSVRQGVLGWGIFLVCLGIVPLAAQLGLIDPSGAVGLLRLWPLILIVVGGYFLVRQFLPALDVSLIWPVIVVAGGALLILAAFSRPRSVS